jgi:hypothetical protein
MPSQKLCGVERVSRGAFFGRRVRFSQILRFSRTLAFAIRKGLPGLFHDARIHTQLTRCASEVLPSAPFDLAKLFINPYFSSCRT